MPFVTIELLGEGLHPSERIVSVVVEDGEKELLTVSTDSISENMIEVGYPIAKRNGSYLVELPRETFTGAWRVWVASDLLKLEDRPA